MKKLLILLCLLNFTATQADTNQLDVIYDEDNRIDYYQIKNPRIKTLANNIASMMRTQQVFPKLGFLNFESSPLKESLNLCDDQKFLQQPTAANCSAFLIADDLLVTAGHCVPDEQTCKDFVWTFDYKIKSLKNIPKSTSLENIYFCEKLLEKSSDLFDESDYALIKLNRKVKHFTPYKINFKKPKLNSKIAVLGFPNGLPLKFANQAKIMSFQSETRFLADLDTFSINSGSLVFNTDNFELEGILVAGAADYKQHPTKDCNIVNKCTITNNDSEFCFGETVQTISSIRNLKTHLENNSKKLN